MRNTGDRLTVQPYNDYLNSIVNRFDYVISDKQRLSGKWYWNHRHQDACDWGHLTPLAGYESNGLVRKKKGGSGDYLYTFNSNNVPDVGLSLTRYGEGDEKPITTKYTAVDVGLPSYVDGLSNGYDDIPSLSVAGVSRNAGRSSGCPCLSQLGTTAPRRWWCRPDRTLRRSSQQVEAGRGRRGVSGIV